MRYPYCRTPKAGEVLPAGTLVNRYLDHLGPGEPTLLEYFETREEWLVPQSAPGFFFRIQTKAQARREMNEQYGV